MKFPSLVSALAAYHLAALAPSSLVLVGAYDVRILRSVLRGTDGNDGIFGLVTVTEVADTGAVTVEAEVTGLPDGPHGFHIHTYGDEVGASDGTAAGGHFDPSGNNPHNGVGVAPIERHVGDLGNIVSSGGTASYSQTFSANDPYRPTVVSDPMANSVIGRAFVVHAGEDDLTTQPTGGAGARLAVGVIGIGNDALYNSEGGGDGGAAAAVAVTEHITSSDFPEPDALVCNIRGAGVIDEGYGSATLSDSTVTFGARIDGPDPNGVHGYHVHTYGEEYLHSASATAPDRDLSRAGGHYNPTGVNHGLPPSEVRHYGDGGSILVDGNGIGTASVALPPGVTTLKHLIGRTCLVHAEADDGGQPAGNAGARVAAGQLGRANPETCVDATRCLLPGETPSPGPRRGASTVAAAALVASGTLISVLLTGM